MFLKKAGLISSEYEITLHTTPESCINGVVEKPFFIRGELMVLVLRGSVMLLCLVFISFGLLAQSDTEASVEPATREALPVSTFAQMRKGNIAKLSPNGDYFAYSLPLDGRVHLVVQKRKAKTKEDYVLIPPMPDADIINFRWGNNKRILVSYYKVAETVTSEFGFTFMMAVDRDGKDFDLLLDPKKERDKGKQFGNVRDRIIDMLPSDPNHVLMLLDVGFDGFTEVRKVNIMTGKSRIVSPQRVGIQYWITDPSGEVRLGYGYFGSDFKAVIKDGGSFRSVKNYDWYKKYALLGFADSGSMAYATTSSSNRRKSLVTLDLESGEVVTTLFQHDVYDLNDVIADEITGQPVGWAFVDDYFQQRFFDTELKRLQKTLSKAFKGKPASIVSYTADRKIVLVNVSDDRDPGTLFIWDRENKQLSPIMEVMPGIEPQKMGLRKPVTYDARDGLPIPGYLTLPVDYREGDKLPVVLLPHGGPHARTVRHFDYSSQFLANRGYAVFQPNFRGSTGYGKAFENVGRKQWGGKMQDDLTDAAHWLIEEGIADPNRICIVGGSYGGYAALMGAVKTPDLFQCAASLNGVADLIKIIRDDINTRIGAKNWVKSIGIEDESVKSVSPYHQADLIEIPILIVQADDDQRVAADQASRMVSRLKSRKKEVTYVPIEKGGHSLYGEKARTIWLSALEDFLDKHIGVSSQREIAQNSPE